MKNVCYFRKAVFLGSVLLALFAASVFWASWFRFGVKQTAKFLLVGRVLGSEETSPAVSHSEKSLPETTPAPRIFRRLTGLWGDIFLVAFSPDGRYLASGSGDGTVILWEMPSGKKIAQLTGHKDWAYGVAFSPDGRYLASGSEDESIILWEMPSGKRLSELTGHEDGVISVAFSPNGRYLASGSGDGTVILWEMPSGKKIAQLTGHKDWVYKVAFSPNGGYLASGSEDKTIILWEMPSGKRIAQLTGHEDEVISVAFSPDGRYLASGSEDKSIILWEMPSGKRLSELTGHKDEVNSVALSPDGRYLASGSTDKTIILWEMPSGKRLFELTGHEYGVISVAFSPDGRYLASGSWDRSIILWEIASRMPSVEEAVIEVEELQANRRPPVISTRYMQWFPIRAAGQEIGPLVYTFRVKNVSDKNKRVLIKIKEYRSGERVREGSESVERMISAGKTSDIALALHPPREPGNWQATAEIYVSGRFGIFKRELVGELNLPLEVVEPEDFPFRPQEANVIGNVLPTYERYEVKTEDLLIVGTKTVLDFFFVGGQGVGSLLTSADASVRARLAPGILSGKLGLKRLKVKEEDGKKALEIGWFFREVKRGRTIFYPGYDRVVVSVILPEGVYVEENHIWSVKREGGKQIAMTIIEGVDKNHGPYMRGKADTSIELNFTDGAVEEKEYEIVVQVMTLIGPFARGVKPAELSEVPVWPEVPIQPKCEGRLADAAWIYDYEQWAQEPEEAVWYLTNAVQDKVRLKVSARPAPVWGVSALWNRTTDKKTDDPAKEPIAIDPGDVIWLVIDKATVNWEGGSFTIEVQNPVAWYYFFTGNERVPLVFSLQEHDDHLRLLLEEEEGKNVVVGITWLECADPVAAVQYCARFSHLSTVQFFEGRGSLDFRKLKSLRVLRLYGVDINESQILMGPANLSELYWNDAPNFLPLFDSQSLRKLFVQAASDEGDWDTAALSRLTNLRELTLVGPVTNLNTLSQLKNLRRLIIASLVTIDLEPVAALKNLEELGACGDGVSDLKPLSRLKNLEKLYLIRTKVSDLQPLSALTNLRVLNLSETPLISIEALSVLKNLEELDISGTKVNSLTPLFELQNLKELYLGRLRSEKLKQELELFKESHPNCRIHSY